MIKTPMCLGCKYFILGEYKCNAFPNGIPFEYLLDKKHSAIDENQEGDYVFTSKSMPIISS